MIQKSLYSFRINRLFSRNKIKLSHMQIKHNYKEINNNSKPMLCCKLHLQHEMKSPIAHFSSCRLLIIFELIKRGNWSNRFNFRRLKLTNWFLFFIEGNKQLFLLLLVKTSCLMCLHVNSFILFSQRRVEVTSKLVLRRLNRNYMLMILLVKVQFSFITNN